MVDNTNTDTIEILDLDKKIKDEDVIELFEKSIKVLIDRIH
jgi:hypothetical protein